MTTIQTVSTPPPIIFELLAYGNSLRCKPEPIGWKECVREMNRNLDDGGITSTFLVKSLTFTGRPAQFLTDLLAEKECIAECKLLIGLFNKRTYSYEYDSTEYQINFESYKKVKVGKYAFGAQFDLINSSATQKLIDRKKVKLNVLSTETCGGLQLSDFPNETLMKVKFPEMKSTFSAKLNTKGLWKTDALYDLFALSKGVNSIPFTTYSSDFSEVQRVQYEFGQANPNDVTPVFHQSQEDKTITGFYNLNFYVDEAFGSWIGGYKKKCEIKYAIYNGLTQISDVKIDSFGDEKGYKNMVGSFPFELKEGESLYFYVDVTDTDGHVHFVRPKTKNSDTEFATQLQFIETIVNTPETIVEGLPIHEFMQRLSELMLDSQWSFYSEFFGRLDAPYFQDPVTKEYLYYASENQERFAHIFAGTNVRGLSIQDADAAINTTWEEAFKSLSAMYNLGYCIEKWTYGGVVRERLRVENLAWFFQDVMALDLSDRISKYDIEEAYMSEYAYVQIIGGYKNYVFLSKNGRGEYNTEVTRSTILPTSNDLDIQSEIAASTIMFSNCLQKPMSTYGSEDLDEDDKLLILKTQRETETPSTNAWKPEFEENMTIENGTSLFQNFSLNLFFTPYWNLIRNSSRIVIPLQKALSSKLKFRTTSKKSGLTTTYAGKTISENEDIVVGTLDAPLIDPIELTVTCEFTKIDLATMESNPYGYIKLTPTISGYLKKHSLKVFENKATFVLYKKHSA